LGFDTEGSFPHTSTGLGSDTGGNLLAVAASICLELSAGTLFAVTGTLLILVVVSSVLDNCFSASCVGSFMEDVCLLALSTDFSEESLLALLSDFLGVCNSAFPEASLTVTIIYA
jgi:hypothetical protein